MKHLFSTLYGSHLYGTAIPGVSDRDEKVVILPSLDDLLLGKSPKNKVVKTEGVDHEEIPIQIFARDFLEGQTYALELAYAVKYNQAEQKVYGERFLLFCEELRGRFLTSNMHSMTRYAVNQANLYSNKGERLNAARDLLNLFEKYPEGYKVSVIHGQELREFQEDYPDHIQLTEYDQSGKGDVQPCIKILDRIIPFTNSVKSAKNTVQSIIDRYGARAKSATRDNVDWKATSHALRIINSGISLLMVKNLRFPYEKEKVDWYKKIRAGEIPFSEVQDSIEMNINFLQKLEKESDLPKLTQELRMEQETWLLKWLKIFYGL